MQGEERKRLRVAGKAYVTNTGKPVHAKSIGKDCKCKKKCYELVPEKDRQRLFQQYYQIPTSSDQNNYLYNLIRRDKVGRKRYPYSDKRTCTYKYYIQLEDNTEVQVCKEAFASIHGITINKVRTICEKLKYNVGFPNDERGRHMNRPNRISKDAIELVKRHICNILDSDQINDFIFKSAKRKGCLNAQKMWHNLAIQNNIIGQEPVLKSWIYYKLLKQIVKARYPHIMLYTNPPRNTEESSKKGKQNMNYLDGVMWSGESGDHCDSDSNSCSLLVMQDESQDSNDKIDDALTTFPRVGEIVRIFNSDEHSEILYVVTESDEVLE